MLRRFGWGASSPEEDGTSPLLIVSKAASFPLDSVSPSIFVSARPAICAAAPPLPSPPVPSRPLPSRRPSLLLVCVCVCVCEREREREPPIRLEQYLQIHQTKKKSSCKESFNNTFKFSSLYPIITYLFILLLHTHYKICCKRIKNTSTDSGSWKERARKPKKHTHTHTQRNKEPVGCCAVPMVLEERFRFFNFWFEGTGSGSVPSGSGTLVSNPKTPSKF